jgi:hypothetical protein
VQHALVAAARRGQRVLDVALCDPSLAWSSHAKWTTLAKPLPDPATAWLVGRRARESITRETLAVTLALRAPAQYATEFPGDPYGFFQRQPECDTGSESEDEWPAEDPTVASDPEQDLLMRAEAQAAAREARAAPSPRPPAAASGSFAGPANGGPSEYIGFTGENAYPSPRSHWDAYDDGLW